MKMDQALASTEKKPLLKMDKFFSKGRNNCDPSSTRKRIFLVFSQHREKSISGYLVVVV